MAAGDPALRLYAILDAEICARRGIPLLAVAQAWQEAGVQLLQYRDKTASRATIVSNATALHALFAASDVFLILNDHTDLVEQCRFDGAHVGQTDSAIGIAREQVGPGRILGLSTHTPDQARQAGSTEADYLAIGPVFPTSTKADAEPPIGVRGVQEARAAVRKPLVAIGGIGAAELQSVRDAGADAVAMISGLLPSDAQCPSTLTRHAQDILARLK